MSKNSFEIIVTNGGIFIVQRYIKDPIAKKAKDRYGKRFLYLSSLEDLLTLSSACESTYQKHIEENTSASSGL